jgi:plasmid stability protein
MPVTLSIENTPDEIVQRLHDRAARNRRSLQGELRAILEDAVRVPVAMAPADVLAQVRQLGLDTPDEATAIVRARRDRR